MRTRTWDVYRDVTIEELSDDSLPESLRGRGIETVEISFRAIGFYQPASMYGGPDHLGWPADRDDERTLVAAKAFIEDRVPVLLTSDEECALFAAFKANVDDTDLDLDGDME